MKAILEFDLNEPDDIMAHMRAVKSLDMAIAIWELVHNSERDILESFKEVTPEMYEMHEAWIARIREKLENQSINIDDLIV
jgi:hypothetical protein